MAALGCFGRPAGLHSGCRGDEENRGEGERDVEQASGEVTWCLLWDTGGQEHRNVLSADPWRGYEEEDQTQELWSLSETQSSQDMLQQYFMPNFHIFLFLFFSPSNIR